MTRIFAAEHSLGHNLMQVIAWVNRVLKDKQGVLTLLHS
jgi:hypothetical protein